MEQKEEANGQWQELRSAAKLVRETYVNMHYSASRKKRFRVQTARFKGKSGITRIRMLVFMPDVRDYFEKLWSSLWGERAAAFLERLESGPMDSETPVQAQCPECHELVILRAQTGNAF